MNQQSRAVRLASIDAYRGLAMLLMASEGLRIAVVAETHPDSPVWQFLARQVEHAEWTGCTLWDLIQPSFTFLAGAALAFSVAARKNRGETWGAGFRHAATRSVTLILLGVFLRSVGRPHTYWTFEDVLSQIGLGYLFLYIVSGWTTRRQATAAGFLLFGYWLAFAMTPLPPDGFDFSGVGISGNWRHLDGFTAHWDKNTNLAAIFDRWFLNLFPREEPFAYNDGGYQTLSFMPSLATMILGLLSGELLRGKMGVKSNARQLLVFGAVGLAAAVALDRLNLCPIVKRIWTPSWVLFSAGWACWILAAFHVALDREKKEIEKGRSGWRWEFPLIVVGMNSIAMYCLAHLQSGFIDDSLKTHFGADWASRWTGGMAPIIEQAAVLLVLWLACLWMYRRRLFLRL